MKTDLERSYEHCIRVARRAARNFYYGFRLMPLRKRRAMCAVYAFMRYADDFADGAGPSDSSPVALDVWRRALARAYEGRVDTHPVMPAFADAVAAFKLPQELFSDLIAGVEMDLHPRTFGTFAELERYCYLVAGVVGLVCVRIWGAPHTNQTARLAVLCGTAFQLTNIVRDVREDAMRGRLYVPIEDLRRFEVPEGDLAGLRDTAAVRSLIRFQAERALSYYDACSPLADAIPADSRAAFLAMHGIYRALAEKIAASPATVLRAKVRLSTMEKTRVVAASLLKSRSGGRPAIVA